MKNFLQHGDTVALTAPAGGVVGGNAYLIGAMFGVAAFSAAEAEPFELRRKGVFTFQKTTSQAWAEGDALYFDPATGKLTTVAGNLRKVAIAVAAALSADTTGKAVIVPTVTIAPAVNIADLAAITGGDAPTEAEHNALRTAVNGILAVLRTHNIMADS